MTDQNKEFYMGSDGALEMYPDSYKVSADKVEMANTIEEGIIYERQNIEGGFLRMGALLMVFEDNELYKAKGVPSMKAYTQSPHLGISARLAHDLIRIAREVGPILERARERGVEPVIPSISKVRNALPLLSEGIDEEEFLEVLEEMEDLTVNDGKRIVRERRGLDNGNESVLFHATVERGEVYNKIWVRRTGPDGDIYEFAKEPWRVKVKDFAQVVDRFKLMVEYV
jgi:hypothetical protein